MYMCVCMCACVRVCVLLVQVFANVLLDQNVILNKEQIFVYMCVCCTCVLLVQVFENPNLKIDDESHQEAVSTCVYRLVGQALTADRALRGSESSRLDG